MKKIFNRIIIPAILLFYSTMIYAQTQKVTGKVTDDKGSPIVSASVRVKGTAVGTTTDEKGEFHVSAPSAATTLVISSLNYGTKEVSISGSYLNLVLTGTASSLDDVVVIGYGTQKLANVSGAISTIKSADIEKAEAVRPDDAIQGRASGVVVIASGSPGVKPTLFVRGIPSFSGSDPLVVVDGTPQTLDDFNAINPADIESINILKDAALTAIYGVSGGNGVVMVTTKSGKRNQKTQFSVTSSYGNQQLAKELGVLNATEYGAILNEGSTTSGGPVIFPNLKALGVGTDWEKQVFQNAPIQAHSVSATGGSDKMTYYLSGGYTDQVGYPRRSKVQ